MRLNIPLGLLLAGVVAWSYLSWVRLRWTRPAQDDVVRAAKLVRERFQPGDLALVTPAHASRIAEHLGDLPFATFRRPADEDLSRWSRLWIISPFGEIPSSLAARFPPAERFRVGRIVIGLHPQPAPARVLFDFRARIAEAAAWVERGRERAPCALSQKRWSCGAEEWNAFSSEFLEVVDEPREVIWAHPDERSTKTLSFANVPLGHDLVVWTGFHGSVIDPRVAAVALAIDVGGREIARLEQRPGQGWTRASIATGSFPGTHEVRFRVLPVANAGQCHFVFQAEARQ